MVSLLSLSYLQHRDISDLVMFASNWERILVTIQAWHSLTISWTHILQTVVLTC